MSALEHALAEEARRDELLAELNRSFGAGESLSPATDEYLAAGMDERISLGSLG